jgi:hypothetical protein
MKMQSMLSISTRKEEEGGVCSEWRRGDVARDLVCLHGVVLDRHSQ